MKRRSTTLLLAALATLAAGAAAADQARASLSVGATVPAPTCRAALGPTGQLLPILCHAPGGGAAGAGAVPQVVRDTDSSLVVIY